MKFIKFLLIAILLLITIMLFRTLTLESKQLDVEPIKISGFDADELAQKLAAGLQIKTISHRDPAKANIAPFREFQQLLKQQFPALHGTLELERVAETLLFRWRGTDANAAPIMLMAHYDVVPVQAETQDRWDFEPFSGQITDDYVLGRGALDDKGQLYMIVAAVEQMVSSGFQPYSDIWLSFGHDEEVGGKYGNEAIAKRFEQQGVRFAAVIDEGGSITRNIVPGIDGRVAMVGIAEKGYLTIQLAVEGVGGHSSMPPEQTTVSTLAKAIADLQAKPFDFRITQPVEKFLAYTAPELPFAKRVAISNRWLLEPLLISEMTKSQKTRATLHTTTAATMLVAGVQENVLAKRAEATINFRILPGETRETVLQRVSEVIDNNRVEIQQSDGFSSDPSPVSSVDSAAFTAIQRSIREVYPNTTVAPFLVMAGTDSRHYSRVADNVYRFAPFDLTGADELDGIHGINERIAIDSLAAGAMLYQRLITHLTAPK